MKYILLITFLTIINNEDGRKETMVSAATSTEFGSREACYLARDSLLEAYGKLKIDAVMICGSYDLVKPAKLTVEFNARSEELRQVREEIAKRMEQAVKIKEASK